MKELRPTEISQPPLREWKSLNLFNVLKILGISLAVQWLRLRSSIARGKGSIPSGKPRFHMSLGTIKKKKNPVDLKMHIGGLCVNAHDLYKGIPNPSEGSLRSPLSTSH